MADVEVFFLSLCGRRGLTHRPRRWTAELEAAFYFLSLKKYQRSALYSEAQASAAQLPQMSTDLPRTSTQVV